MPVKTSAILSSSRRARIWMTREDVSCRWRDNISEHPGALTVVAQIPRGTLQDRRCLRIASPKHSGSRLQSRRDPLCCRHAAGQAWLRRRAASTRHTLGHPLLPPAMLRDPEGSRSRDVTLSPPVGAAAAWRPRDPDSPRGSSSHSARRRQQSPNSPADRAMRRRDEQASPPQASHTRSATTPAATIAVDTRSAFVSLASTTWKGFAGRSHDSPSATGCDHSSATRCRSFKNAAKSSSLS